MLRQFDEQLQFTAKRRIKEHPSKSFVESAHETAFVTPQILEGHDLAACLSGINLFYFFRNVLLHGVLNGDVLAIRRRIVARYGFAKALRGVGSAVARREKLDKKRDKKKMQEELILIINCSKPSVNQQRVKKDGISRLHGEITASDAHVIGCWAPHTHKHTHARARYMRARNKVGKEIQNQRRLHTLWARSRSCPAWRRDTLCSHLLPVLLTQRQARNTATQNLNCHVPSQSG